MTLRDRVAGLGRAADAVLVRAPTGVLTLADIGAPTDAARGAIVAICCHAPARFIAELLALDGHAAGLLLLAPALPAATIETLMAQAGASMLRTDRDDLGDLSLPDAPAQTAPGPTQWLMTTSGTTGIPKIVRHTLDSLTRSVRVMAPPLPRWGLVYEPSRFAGLQVVLQALLGGGELIAPDPDGDVGARMRFLAQHGCTHLSATPTLWRKILMLPEAALLAPQQVTLGGETADAGILRALAARYPAARITHIYASTEAGVGFSVKDGLPGIPASYVKDGIGGARLRVIDGELWIKPPGPAPEANRRADHITVDADGYLRTGDLVRDDGDRIYFLGRDSSTINIGGTKVHPEDVEAIVNEHPDVAASQVSSRPNPLVGALLTLTVAPRDPAMDAAAFKQSIKAWCRDRLPREAQPATIKIVESIAATAAGKLSRTAM
jgi:acyl-CoA synthetase (AMP-forming)/AMP-acid ligase II